MLGPRGDAPEPGTSGFFPSSGFPESGYVENGAICPDSGPGRQVRRLGPASHPGVSADRNLACVIVLFLPWLARSARPATAVGPHGVDRHRFHSVSGTVSRVRRSPGRGQRPSLHVVSLWRGGGVAPGTLGCCASGGRTRAVLRASLQPRPGRVQAIASSAVPWERLSIGVYRPDVSPSSSVPVCLCWEGGPRVRRFWEREVASNVRPTARRGGLWMRGCYQMFTLAVIAAVLRGCPCFELGPSFWPPSSSDFRCAGWHNGHIWFGLGVAGSGIPGIWLARPPGCSLLGPWPAPFPWLP